MQDHTEEIASDGHCDATFQRALDRYCTPLLRAGVLYRPLHMLLLRPYHARRHSTDYAFFGLARRFAVNHAFARLICAAPPIRPVARRRKAEGSGVGVVVDSQPPVPMETRL